MHIYLNLIKKNLVLKLFLIFFMSLGSNLYADQSVENIIKGRKALFSKNYNTAKRVQTFSSSGKFDKANELILEMSENYKKLLTMFPENTKEGFKTEALPIIWEDKKAFNALMEKSSDNMIKLAKTIETTEDLSGTLKALMWGSCKACHNKYRAEH
ncbi:cytochrome c [Candidatus Pelagibacter sp.]|nr:cytochrome c [Candidatus Pelagibacter sp.]